MKQLKILGMILLIFSASCLFAQNQNDELLKSVDEILIKVSEIRGLSAIDPIKKGVKTRAEIEQYILKRFEEEYPTEDLKNEERLLKRLSLIPSDLDLHDLLIEFYTEQIAGLYDPKVNEFFIADWIPLELQKPVMAHELTHALQDQHFDLERFITRVPGNDDEMMAKAALIEGEALLVMLQYTLEPFGTSVFDIQDIRKMTESQRSLMEAQFPVFASAPDYLKETSLFPYTYGASFVQFLIKTSSWKDLEDVYTKTPLSTEQIIHPEKYKNDPDSPVNIPEITDLPPEFGTNPEQFYSNVLVEFTLFLVLGQFLNPEESEIASAGWDGDRVQLFESEDKKTILRLETVWDSNSDATEFFEAYKKLVGLKFDGTERLTSDNPGLSHVWKSASHTITLQQYENRVTVFETEAK